MLAIVTLDLSVGGVALLAELLAGGEKTIGPLIPRPFRSALCRHASSAPMSPGMIRRTNSSNIGTANASFIRHRCDTSTPRTRRDLHPVTAHHYPDTRPLYVGTSPPATCPFPSI